jgi:hypothetical protein
MPTPTRVFWLPCTFGSHTAEAASARAAAMQEPIHAGSQSRFEFDNGVRSAAQRGAIATANATALTLGANVLLTFDSAQAALPKAEAFKVKP